MTKVFPPSPSYGATNKSRDTEPDLGAKASETRDTVKDKVIEVKDKVIEVKDKVIEIKDQVVDRGSATLKGVRHFVATHPLKAVAIAFGLGFVGMRVTRPLRWL